MSDTIAAAANSQEDAAPQRLPHDGSGELAHWAGALPEQARQLAEAKGWRSPADAVHSYAHLESKLGAKRVALPGDNASAEEVQAFYRVLGAPEAPDDYRLPAGVAFDDGEFEQWSRATAHRLGLTEKQFETLAGDFHAMVDGRQQANGARSAQALHAAEERLRHDWGDAFEANLAGARRAAAMLGVSPGALNAMAQAAGIEPVNRFFADLHGKYGIGREDDLRLGTSPTGFGMLSRNEALAQIHELEALQAYQDVLAQKPVGNIDQVLARRDRLYAMAYPDGE